MATKNAELDPATIKKYNLPPELNPKLDSLRCQTCKRFLAYHAIVEGTVAIKCKKCDTWNVIDVHNLEKAPIDKQAPATQ